MSYTERVLLDIKITLNNVRAVYKELDAVQKKAKELTLSPAKENMAAQNNAAVGFRNLVTQIESEKSRIQTEFADKEFALMEGRSRAKYVMMERDRAAQLANIQATSAAKIKEAEEMKILDDKISKNAIQQAAQRQKILDQKAAQAQRDMQKRIKESMQVAFSLHIISTYVQPFAQAIVDTLRSTITAFTEFERYYADYIGKSADFKEVMSRGEIFSAAAGQVYSINDMADAMERFAASGIDITKNEQALTDVLQLARTAQIDYTVAANAVIKTQEAFQLSVNDSTMIVDALTAAANSSTAELKDLTEWFGYASGMAHETSISVQQLAAYLGILSSTGMKSAGTAFRQMLVQFTNEDVRAKIDAAFGQKFDYLQMDETLARMRQFVQESGNQAEVIQQVSNALGGKVNAREALARLLTADEATWNRIMGAVSKSGVSAELFGTVTDNAADTLLKIQNNITIIKTQIGEVVAPILKLAEAFTTALVNAMNIIPGFIKSTVLGGILLAAAAIAVLMGGITTLVGMFYLTNAALDLFKDKGILASFSIKQLVMDFKQLNMQLLQSTVGLKSSAATLGGVQTATKNMAASFLSINSSMMWATVSMGAFAAQSYAATEQSYQLAKAMNIVASLTAGVSAGMMVGGGAQGVLVGGLVAGSSLYAGQSQLSRAEDELKLNRRNKAWYQSSASGGSVYSNNSKNVNIDTAYFSAEEMDADSFIDTVGNV